ncbi:Uncharacterized protein HZ326_27496 [Fusarium oxysporum f. sp. albedinis]|nr:Uncharacterized protein HZ326_27496 [Fusarium oxysporum f. sp. albedinis]
MRFSEDVRSRRVLSEAAELRQSRSNVFGTITRHITLNSVATNINNMILPIWTPSQNYCIVKGHSNASTTPLPSRFRRSVIVIFAPEKSLSGSADIAGIDSISTAILLRLG